MSDDQRIEPIWLDRRDLLAIHDRQLAEHGGGAGLRDVNLLESALSRPRNSWAYADPDLTGMAAEYAFGIARNHSFVDGNKRTAWVAARLFLRLNGVTLSFDKVDAIRVMLALAAGELAEEELADWFHGRIAG